MFTALKSSNPDPVDPVVLVGALEAIDHMVPGWIEILTAQIETGMRAGWELLGEELGTSIDFALVEPFAVTYARELAAQAITHVAETTKEEVRIVLEQAVSEGWSINKTADAISDLYRDFDVQRSITIARTEIAAAMNWGKHEAAVYTAESLGMELEKRWSAVHDGRTRETHAAMSAEWIGFDEYFSVGGNRALRPHDPNLPASETINCRCVLLTREAKPTTENTEQ